MNDVLDVIEEVLSWDLADDATGDAVAAVLAGARGDELDVNDLL